MIKDMGPFLALFSGDELSSVATKVPLCSIVRRSLEGRESVFGYTPLGLLPACSSGTFLPAPRGSDVSSCAPAEVRSLRAVGPPCHLRAFQQHGQRGSVTCTYFIEHSLGVIEAECHFI